MNSICCLTSLVLQTLKSKCLSVRDQLFVTLLRLRRGFNLSSLAHMYSVSDSYISNIFTTWIMFLYQHFKDYETVMFPERQVFKQFMPKVFKKFKNIRASIDCTEFFCEVPRDYGCQGNMYSSYKHHTTMKCLIAVNLNGAACFVSDLYEGSVDDVRIFKTCGLFNPGDSFLVDKGFTVQDVLLSKQATIFIPPFLGKRDSLTKKEIMLTKRIAKAGIHVERFNERLKKFRLTCGTIPLVLSPMASQLVYYASELELFSKMVKNRFIFAGINFREWPLRDISRVKSFANGGKSGSEKDNNLCPLFEKHGSQRERDIETRLKSIKC
ncbi:uncharacterized protein LOC130642372 [Hydractinia symbiolongicarpus]|uniref:uncharacterized protein LOC130642372 n=1 Tax=Hydractinia symbiolongicarpus TaxID=13093 RepID=UPI00254A38AF|nr:uncharacterized protein LOC130642372 [Hydractinia symbiolongicarpus]